MCKTSTGALQASGWILSKTSRNCALGHARAFGVLHDKLNGVQSGVSSEYFWHYHAILLGQVADLCLAAQTSPARVAFSLVCNSSLIALPTTFPRHAFSIVGVRKSLRSVRASAGVIMRSQVCRQGSAVRCHRDVLCPREDDRARFSISSDQTWPSNKACLGTPQSQDRPTLQ